MNTRLYALDGPAGQLRSTADPFERNVAPIVPKIRHELSKQERDHFGEESYVDPYDIEADWRERA